MISLTKSAPLTTQEEARSTRHEAGVCFLCAQCRKVKPVQHSGGTGYAYNSQNQILCYACCDANQRDDLKDRSKSFGAYVSGDGRTITTWTGGKLMTVTQSWPCRLTRRSNWHDAESFKCIRATDVHGGKWFGRGSPGIVIKLRPCK